MLGESSFRKTLVIFGLASLIGPVLALTSSLLKLDTSSAPTGTSVLADFIYDFVLLVWPPQPLGVLEAVIGTLGAAILTVGANVLIFGIIGVIRYGLRSRPFPSLLLWLVVTALTTLIALWASGFDKNFLNVVALLSASALYAVLIWTTKSSAGEVRFA